MARRSSRSVFGSRAMGQRLERMHASARWTDGAFRNTTAVTQGLKRGTALRTMSEFIRGGVDRVPPSPLPSRSPLESWARPVETGLRATWLGHSTVLLEVDGLRILTDPVWGERASPFRNAGPKRFQPVPVSLSAVPELDAVIVSHDHYDHLDFPTILSLATRDVPFITSLGVGAHLEAWGIPPERIVELDWWETFQIPGSEVVVAAAPSQHFSGRSLRARNRTLWSSFVVQGPRHRIFFSGDTGLTPEYTEIARRLGPFDLVMLEVGAFHPSWGDIHLGPENALKALQLLGNAPFLPVHWGTFNLAIHAWDDPAESLLRMAAPDVRLILPRLGEPVETSRAERPQPWWRAVAEQPPEPLMKAAEDGTPELVPGEPID